MFLCMSPHTCTLPRLVFSSLHSNGETDMDAVRQEMIEMRRAVLREVDINQDSLVSRREFITFSQEPEFRKDGKWKTVFPDFQGNELKEFAQQLKKAKQEHKAKLRRLRNATADGAEEKEEQGKSDSSDEGDGSNGDRPIKSRFVEASRRFADRLNSGTGFLKKAVKPLSDLKRKFAGRNKAEDKDEE